MLIRCLHRVEVYAASILRFEVCRVGEFHNFPGSLSLLVQTGHKSRLFPIRSLDTLTYIYIYIQELTLHSSILKIEAAYTSETSETVPTFML
jgi:hypothetical protein